MKDSTLSQVGKHSILVLTRRVLDILLGIATATIVARALGPGGQGIYSLALLLPSTLATFLNLGLSPATVFYSSKEGADLDSIVVTSVYAGLVLGFFGILFGSVVVLTAGSSLFPGVPTSLLWIAMAIVPLHLMASFLNSVFQGLRDFKTYNAISLSRRVAYLVLLVLLFVGATPFMAVIASLGATAIQVTLALGLLKHKGFRLFRAASITAVYVKRSFWYGFRAHLSNIVSFLHYRIDMFILGAMTNPVSVGLYSVAVKLAEQLWLFSRGLSEVVLPHVAGSSDEETRKEISGTVSRNILWISILISLVLFLLSRFIVRLLFGSAYNEAATLLQILLPGIALGAMGRILSTYVAAIGKPQINMYFSLVAVISNVILNLVMIPSLGAEGAAWATTITYASNTILKTWYVGHRLGLGFRRILVLRKDDLCTYVRAVRRILTGSKTQRHKDPN